MKTDKWGNTGMTVYYDWAAEHRNRAAWMERTKALRASDLPEPLAAIMREVERHFVLGHSYRFEHQWEGGNDGSDAVNIENGASAIYNLAGQIGDRTCYDYDPKP